MNSQINFIKFYNTIKFSQEDNNQYLKKRRNQLVKEIQRYLKEEGKPAIKVYNQGSYDLGTGIKPLGKRDFDIDIALVFDVQTRDYKDPTELKQWVVNAINRYSHGQPEMRTPCVRVEFKKNGRVHYHVDLAVYGYCNNVKHIFLEKCKQNQYGLAVKLPIRPKNALFIDINQSSKHREKYLKKMKQLCKAVKQAYQDPNTPDAIQLLRGQLGSDFPI